MLLEMFVKKGMQRGRAAAAAAGFKPPSCCGRSRGMQEEEEEEEGQESGIAAGSCCSEPNPSCAREALSVSLTRIDHPQCVGHQKKKASRISDLSHTKQKNEQNKTIILMY